MDTRIRSRRELAYTRRLGLTHSVLCWTLQIQWIHRNLQTLTWKSKNSYLKIKNLKQPKFSEFLGLKNLKNLGFFKWVRTACRHSVPGFRHTGFMRVLISRFHNNEYSWAMTSLVCCSCLKNAVWRCVVLLRRKIPPETLLLRRKIFLPCL